MVYYYFIILPIVVFISLETLVNNQMLDSNYL